MREQRHPPTSPSFFPSTPKIPKRPLSEEPCIGPSRPVTRVDIRRPETPAHPRASAKANPTAGQPAKPLKSILKGSTKNVHPYDSCESDSEMLIAKKAGCSRYHVPNVAPPGSHLCPMKPPAFALHWQLLPFDQRRSKRLLRFDVAFPVEQIAFQEGAYRTKLSEADLNKAAANDMLTKMFIAFEHESFSWQVDVKNAHGICCRDVFEAIHKSLNEQLTLEEQRMVRNRRAVEEAFLLRCQFAFVPDAERRLGWKRVDVLTHRTIFRGLTQLKPGSDWVLNLGKPHHLPGFS